MGKKMTVGVWFAIAITFVIAITSLCIAAYRSQHLGFDYIGVIVAILSMLVTILIGWNLYTIIDIKSIKDDVDKKVNESIETHGRTTFFMAKSAMCDIHKELFEIYARNPYLSNDTVEPFIRQGLNYLEYSIDIGRSGCAYQVYQIFSDCIKEKKKISNHEKDRIREIMNRIKHKASGMYYVDKIFTLLNIYIQYTEE